LKQSPPKAQAEAAPQISVQSGSANGTHVQTETGKRVKRVIEAVCEALITAENELTELDRITGDGDLGTSMKRAAIAVRHAADSYPLDDVAATLKALSNTLRHELGGSSGPLYGVLFLRAGNVLEKSGSTSLAQWANALEEGCRAVSELGGAKPGDRTMLDALYPFATFLKGAGQNASREVLLAAVRESARGVAATSKMKPRLGRSSYLQDRVLGYPDPGARAVAIWSTAIAQALYPN